MFQGHTSWKSGRSSNYEWMWCVPSSCNQTDIQEALELSLDPLKVEDRVDMVVNVSCRTAETDQAVFDISDWIYMYVDLFTYRILIQAVFGVTGNRWHHYLLGASRARLNAHIARQTCQSKFYLII